MQEGQAVQLRTGCHAQPGFQVHAISLDGIGGKAQPHGGVGFFSNRGQSAGILRARGPERIRAFDLVRGRHIGNPFDQDPADSLGQPDPRAPVHSARSAYGRSSCIDTLFNQTAVRMGTVTIVDSGDRLAGILVDKLPDAAMIPAWQASLLPVSVPDCTNRKAYW